MICSAISLAHNKSNVFISFNIKLKLVELHFRTKTSVGVRALPPTDADEQYLIQTNSDFLFSASGTTTN